MSDDNTKTPAPEKKGKNTSASADEQLKFLLSCIRYSVNGKIDFVEVAKECNIISKGAAAKRYERLMKAHNIEKKDLLNPRDASVASTKVKKGEVKAGTAAAANKKRKVVEADLANDDEDDEETVPAMKKKRFKKEKAVKSEDGVNSEDEAMSQAKVKDEDSESAGVPQVDGASDICFVKEEAAVTTKSQPGAAVKSEPVWEPMATNNIHAIEYEPIYDQLLQPGDFSQTIIIAD